MTNPINPADFGEPYEDRGSWCVDEESHPECRGYVVHKFLTEAEAKQFLSANEAAYNAQKLPEVSGMGVAVESAAPDRKSALDALDRFDGMTFNGNIEAWQKLGQLLDGHRKTIRAALATLDRLIAEQGWQPIETAPKDGTVFDVYTKYGRVTNCVACKQFGRIYSYNQESDNYDRKVNFATHWMPLPQPPTMQGE